MVDSLGRGFFPTIIERKFAPTRNACIPTLVPPDGGNLVVPGQAGKGHGRHRHGWFKEKQPRD